MTEAYKRQKTPYFLRRYRFSFMHSKIEVETAVRPAPATAPDTFPSFGGKVERRSSGIRRAARRLRIRPPPPIVEDPVDSWPGKELTSTKRSQKNNKRT